MPTDCPMCCRALAEIERIVVHIEETTSNYLAQSERYVTQEDLAEREKLVSEYRRTVGNDISKIVRMSRGARDVECREG